MNKPKLKTILAIASLLCVIPASVAQNVNTSNQERVQQEGKNPLYTIKINVVERNAKAINYRHRSGSTTIGFNGTALMPEARGEAKVESKQGYIEIEVEFRELTPPAQFGPEYNAMAPPPNVSTS